MSDDEDGSYAEYNAVFVGLCTCDHEEDEHGWGSCNAEDCPCEAGWEE